MIISFSFKVEMWILFENDHSKIATPTSKKARDNFLTRWPITYNSWSEQGWFTLMSMDTLSFGLYVSLPWQLSPLLSYFIGTATDHSTHSAWLACKICWRKYTSLPGHTSKHMRVWGKGSTTFCIEFLCESLRESPEGLWSANFRRKLARE